MKSGNIHVLTIIYLFWVWFLFLSLAQAWPINVCLWAFFFLPPKNRQEKNWLLRNRDGSKIESHTTASPKNERERKRESNYCSCKAFSVIPFNISNRPINQPTSDIKSILMYRRFPFHLAPFCISFHIFFFFLLCVFY